MNPVQAGSPIFFLKGEDSLACQYVVWVLAKLLPATVTAYIQASLNQIRQQLTIQVMN